MITFFSVNEFNVFWFLLKSIAGRPVYLLNVDPWFPALKSLLRRLLEVFVERGTIKQAAELFPNLARYEEWNSELSFAHLYPQFEPEIRKYYRLEEDHRASEYAIAFKHAASCRIKINIEHAARLSEYADDFVRQDIRFSGLRRDLICLYEEFHGQPINGTRAGGPGIAQYANILFTILIMIVTQWNIIRKTRISVRQRAKAALGADLAEEGRVRNFFKQIAEEPSEIIYVLRNDAVRDTLAPEELARYRHALLSEGQFPIGQVLGLMFQSLRDVYRVHMAFAWLPGDVYFALVKQVNKRLQFRAFFNVYHFDAFLARDEYNTDHITRSQELRRKGILSLGLLHGMATAPRVYPHLRYLDFDSIYLFGKRQGDAYADTWPADMTIKAYGGYSLTREQLAELAAPKSRDIVVFCNQFTDPLAHATSIADIARSFPDRKVYIKLKYPRNYIGDRLYDPYIESLGDLPANAEFAEGSPYELMLRSGYAISGLSTVIAEALEIGLTTYFLDVYKPEQDVFFRDFPELCVRNTDEIRARIRAQEEGVETYPRERFGDLVDLSTQNVFDQIRAEISLAPWSGRHDDGAA